MMDVVIEAAVTVATPNHAAIIRLVGTIDGTKDGTTVGTTVGTKDATMADIMDITRALVGSQT